MFVCTGNICRSAMAEYLLKNKLKETKKENEIVVESCGTTAYTGESATQNTISILQKHRYSRRKKASCDKPSRCRYCRK